MYMSVDKQKEKRGRKMSIIISRNVTVNVSNFLESLESSLKARVQYNKENNVNFSDITIANEEDYELIKMEVIAAFEMGILSFTEYNDVCDYFYKTYVTPDKEAALGVEDLKGYYEKERKNKAYGI